MSNEIKVNLKNLSDAEREQLMKLIEKANTPASKVWKPVEGETTYVIWANGCIHETRQLNMSLDALYYQGNVFATREEAKFESHRRKILKRWEDMSAESGEAENKWNDKNKHWYCYCEGSTIKTHWVLCHRSENTYYATRESLENAIAEIGEENVKKYILGVK